MRNTCDIRSKLDSQYNHGRREEVGAGSVQVQVGWEEVGAGSVQVQVGWEEEGAGSVQVQAPSGVPASTILPPAVVMAANNYYGLPQVPQVRPGTSN